MKLQGNVSLILGLSIPVAMILFVAASIYLPAMFVKPAYNFLYATSEGYSYGGHEYSLDSEGKIHKNDRASWAPESKQPLPEERLYVHNVATNESSETTYEQALNMRFEAGEKSPDGFTVQHGNRDDGFFPFIFWSGGSDYSITYLVRGSFSKKLNLLGSTNYYNNFYVIGWSQQ